MRSLKDAVLTTYRNYLIGFAISLATTFVAYFSVTESWAAGWTLLGILGALALGQMIVQLYFFLHLSGEAKSRLRTWSFVFMAGILVIIVAGSLWIMGHLNYNMTHMSSQEKDYYMMSQKDKGF